MQTVAFDLAAYRRRIGLADNLNLDLTGLAHVQDAHIRTIAFENLDILLGRGVSVEPDKVFDRLVTDQRGGYCFTSNALLCTALQHLGFDASLHLGRVLFGPPGPTPARLHALVLIKLNQQTYLADVGFGAHTPRGIMPLNDGAELQAVDRTWRLTTDPEHGWRLQDHTPDGWRDLYLFDDARVYPADVDVANFWIATCTQSPFVNALLAVRHTHDGRITLLNRTAAQYHGTTSIKHQVTDPQSFRDYIEKDLGLDLKADTAAWDALWQKSSGEPMPVDW